MQLLKINEKGVEKGGIEDLQKATFTWLDIVNPSDSELKQIYEKTGIPIEDLKDSISQWQRPIALNLGEYSEIVIREVKKTEETETIPIATFLSQKYIITIRKEETQAFRRIKEYSEERIAMFKDPGIFVKRLLEEVNDEYFQALDVLDELIDDLEDEAFENPTKKVAEKVFRVKKELIRINKSASANREMVAGIEKEYITQIPKRHIKEFRDIYNDCVQIREIGETYRDIVTGILDVYLSSVSANLNITMKKLTAYGALILFPTLISGIYGMNFKFMPELGWQKGYIFALSLMIFSVIVLYIYFKKLDYI